MKRILKYSMFIEKIIIPDKLTGSFTDLESLKEYGKLNNFDVCDYDEFFNSLDDVNKKTTPPKNGSPFFALFHPINKKPMFVVCDNFMFKIPNIVSIVNSIIEHERIHSTQTGKRNNLSYELPDPKIMKDYFSNKDEIMAFSYNIAKSLLSVSNSLEDCMKKLKSGNFSDYRLWNDIKKNCNEEIVNRYRKYIYLYCEVFSKEFKNDKVGKLSDLNSEEVKKSEKISKVGKSFSKEDIEKIISLPMDELINFRNSLSNEELSDLRKILIEIK